MYFSDFKQFGFPKIQQAFTFPQFFSICEMLVSVCSVAPVVMQDRLEKLFDLVPDDEAEKEAETEKIPIANEEKLAVEKIPIANEEKLAVEKIPIANEEKLAVEKIPIANEEKLAVEKIPIANEEKLAVAEEDLPKGNLACLDIKHSLFHPFSVLPPRHIIY